MDIKVDFFEALVSDIEFLIKAYNDTREGMITVFPQNYYDSLKERVFTAQELLVKNLNNICKSEDRVQVPCRCTQHEEHLKEKDAIIKELKIVIKALAKQID